MDKGTNRKGREKSTVTGSNDHDLYSNYIFEKRNTKFRK